LKIGDQIASDKISILLQARLLTHSFADILQASSFKAEQTTFLKLVKVQQRGLGTFKYFIDISTRKRTQNIPARR
jgi:hypothetical protein